MVTETMKKRSIITPKVARDLCISSARESSRVGDVLNTKRFLEEADNIEALRIQEVEDVNRFLNVSGAPVLIPSRTKQIRIVRGRVTFPALTMDPDILKQPEGLAHAHPMAEEWVRRWRVARNLESCLHIALEEFEPRCPLYVGHYAVDAESEHWLLITVYSGHGAEDSAKSLDRYKRRSRKALPKSKRGKIRISIFQAPDYIRGGVRETS